MLAADFDEHTTNLGALDAGTACTAGSKGDITARIEVQRSALALQSGANARLEQSPTRLRTTKAGDAEMHQELLPAQICL